MYNINAGEKARTDLYGNGKGDAHVWDFSSAEKIIDSHRRIRQAEIAQKVKQGDINQNDAEKQINALNSKAIHPNDLPYFTKKQEDIRNYTKQNINAIRNNDPNAVLGLQKMIGNYDQEAELSKNFREGSEAAYTGVNAGRKEGKQFRPESLQSIDAAQVAPYKTGWDVTKLKPEVNFDSDKYVNSVIGKEALEKGNGTDNTYIDPKTGDRVQVAPDKISEKESRPLIAKHIRQNPQFAEQENYNLSKEPADVQARYNAGKSLDDLANYAADKYHSNIEFDHSKYSRTETSSGGESDIEESTDEKPLSYKINTLGDKGTPVEGTVNVVARSTFNKPVKVIGALTGTVRTVDGNKPINGADVVSTEFGESNVVPVYKKGTTAVIDGKNVDISGNVVPDAVLEHGKKNDKVEYKTMVNGVAKINTGKKNINEMPIYEEKAITKPADEVKGALLKGKVPLDKLNDYSEKANKLLHSPAQETAESWNTKWASLPKGGSLVGRDGKTYIKK